PAIIMQAVDFAAVPLQILGVVIPGAAIPNGKVQIASVIKNDPASVVLAALGVGSGLIKNLQIHQRGIGELGSGQRGIAALSIAAGIGITEIKPIEFIACAVTWMQSQIQQTALAVDVDLRQSVNLRRDGTVSNAIELCTAIRHQHVPVG